MESQGQTRPAPAPVVDMRVDRLRSRSPLPAETGQGRSRAQKAAQHSQAAQPAPAAPAKVTGRANSQDHQGPCGGDGRNGLGKAASQKYQGSMSQRYDRILLRGS